MNTDWLTRSENLNWDEKRKFVQLSQYRPMYDREFSRVLEDLSKENYFRDPPQLRQDFLRDFDRWIHDSKLNKVSGLEQFPDRDFTIGVTHSLDDLHITHGSSLVVMEKEYAYHRRMKPDITVRTVETLKAGDVLVFAIPSSWYGDIHPQTNEILDRCRELSIPVHVDAAWYGCLRGFEFDYSHPAIQSVSFSLSKGLGLGSHRAGARYCRKRQPGPVTIINDFNMCIVSVMWYGIKFMREFGSDFIQDKYGAAYEHVCKKLQLRPTKAIHIAFMEKNPGEWMPVGIRPFLRYLVDQVDELK